MVDPSLETAMLPCLEPREDRPRLVKNERLGSNKPYRLDGKRQQECCRDARSEGGQSHFMAARQGSGALLLAESSRRPAAVKD